MPNKKKNFLKRKQKRLEKSRKKRQRKKKQQRKDTKPTLSKNKFPEWEYKFWLCHGANYLASDFEEVKWTPIFPEIYEGTRPSDLDKIRKRAFSSPHTNPLVMAWVLHQREVVWRYLKESMNRVSKIEKESRSVEERKKAVRKPLNPFVWQMFEELKKSKNTESKNIEPAEDTQND